IAKDPIVVQVLRRTPRPRGQGSAQDVQLVDVCTQTEITFEHIMALAKLPPTHSSSADRDASGLLSLQEVELRRLSCQEKLGLTLCYRTDEDEDIYVSEIEPNSIAARDGRIREGDRILQINGRDVQDRQEAVAVLSNEECRNIVLLVARPEIQDEPWLDDEHSEYLEELKMEMLEEEEEEMKRAAREEDQKVRETSIYHKQSSQKSVLAQIQKQLSRCVSGRSSADGAEKLLELKCQIRSGGEYDLFYARSSSSSIQCSGVERELRLLNEELRSIQLECQSIMKVGTHSTVQSLRHLWSQLNYSVHQLGSRERPEKSDKDSSSAYNTAESSRSTPLAADRSPEHPLRRAPSGSPDHSNPSESEQTPPEGPQRQSCMQLIQQQTALEFISRPSEPKMEWKVKVRSDGTRVSLTNRRKLLALRRAPSGSPDHSNPSESEQTPPEGPQRQSCMQLIQQQTALEFISRPSEPKMEWKVKVRSDGTRYITKRPVRDRLLRERALKIKEERSGGMTTDDDAMSEMKMGRYWSKEQRKQHLLQAKEQRRRREFMQRSRLESLRENPLSSGEGRSEPSIIELSHRKMMKKRNKKILDNWMTIQELMTHGEKAPEGSAVHNAFLSVTTV
uniref:PDZ domain-containing protein n=1 Tax=Sinocyclocheilus anshuiensis TaxID=1608454 RepID=A0A671MNL1_9TELE